MSLFVTGGSVRIEDGTKAREEYSPARKVAVELHFDVTEGADAQRVLERVAAMAHAEVRRLLHQNIEEVHERAEAALAAAEPNGAGVDAELAAAPEPAKRRGRPAGSKNKPADPAGLPADPEATAIDQSGDAGDAVGEGTATTEANDPAALPTEPAVAEQAASTQVGDAAARSTEAASPSITDQELHAAIQKTNAKINDTAKIKAHILSFRTDPTKAWSAAAIPAGRRQEFLDGLEALAGG